VERHHAAGGIALTASHNPVEWNALKFVGPSGRFLSPEEAASFFSRVDGALPAATWNALGTYKTVPDAVEHHVDLIVGLPEVNPRAIEKSRLRVIVDAVHGAGGAIARRLLERLGCDHTILYEEPTGHFPRSPEPLAEHLGDLAGEVKKQGADIGLAFDPDVDRLSLVDEAGTAIGEECTLALAADHVLGVRPGPVVTNLSTSARIEAVASRHGQEVLRTPVGEANVVAGIVSSKARIGGEGNGGVILPGLHLGRDAPCGAALVLTGLAEGSGSLSRWTGTLPDLVMIKERVDLTREPDWDEAKEAIAQSLPGAREDRSDGLRMAGDGEWVHLRKSGTEPIVRIIAEAATRERARELVGAVESVLVR
jgi:phosphomannomutase